MNARLDHNIALEHAAEAVRRAAELYSVPEAAECRSIAVRTEDQWVNYATILRVGDTWPDGDGEDICAGDMRLMRWRVEPARIRTGESLVAALSKWRRRVGRGDEADFQDPAHAHRMYRGDSATGSPCWRVELHDRASNTSSKNPPQGPFFDEGSGFFAESVVDAAAAWFGDPSWPNSNHIEGRYHVHIQDRRGTMQDIALSDEKQLAVRVEGRAAASLHVCAKFFDARRATGKDVQAVNSGSAAVQLPEDVDSIALFLMAETGECLDKYQEGEFYRSWGEGVLHPVNPVLRELREAILYGEGQVTELKQFIPRKGEKAGELLRTVAAFSNTKGGAVLVGVEDDGEATGVLRHLGEPYGGEFGNDVDGMKARYVSDLKNLISEGVEPTVRPTFQWNDVAGVDVLRISVPRGAAPPYRDVRSGNIYVRPAGRNRKALPEELERMYSAKQEGLERSRR